MLLSIIIPVYKVEATLRECLDSVLKEAPTDSEIILVDDGSPDNSPQICDEYVLKDSRVRVIHQNNCGLSGARNAGLDISTGEKIFFIDSDDFLSEGYFKTILSQQRDSDLIIGNYRAFYSDGHADIVGDFKKQQYDSLEAYLKDFHLYFGTIFNFAWGKMYDASIIKNNSLRFEEGISMVEDVLFNLKYYFFCKNIIIEPEAKLCYRQSSNSLSKKQNSLLFEWYFKSYDGIKALLKNNSSFGDKNFKCFYTSMYGNVLESVFSIYKLPSDQRNKIYNEIFNSVEVQKCIEFNNSYKTKGIALAIKRKSITNLNLQVRIYIFLLNVKKKLRGMKR